MHRPAQVAGTKNKVSDIQKNRETEFCLCLSDILNNNIDSFVPGTMRSELC